jgi:hypothetical protein
LLYTAALDSKELAVSLPVVIAVWEILFEPPKWRPVEMLRWIRGGFLPPLLTGVMTAAYIWGRVINPSGIGELVEAYRPHYTLGTALETTSRYLNDLFYTRTFFDAKKTAVFILLLLVSALIARSRSLLLCWVVFVAGILPMAFIQLRPLAAVWIPVSGLIVYSAIAAAMLRDLLLRAAGRLPWKPVAQVALFLLAAWLTRQQPGIRYIYNASMREYLSIYNVRRSFATLCPSMPKGSSVLIVTDPLNGSFSTAFLVQLMYRGFVANVSPLFTYKRPITRVEARQYTFIFDYQDGKLTRLDPAAYAATLPH